MNRWAQSYGWLVLGLAVGLASANCQSFWIDEGTTAMLGLQPSLRALWATARELRTSELQMPLYSLYQWGWARFAGRSEYILRLSNLPWVLLAAWSARRSSAWLILLMVSPFTVYYAGELRPYALQIGCASLCVSQLFAPVDERGTASDVHRFMPGFFLLCAGTLTGVLWATGFALAWAITRAGTWRLRRVRWALLPWVVPLALLALYYAWAVLGAGSRPAALATENPVVLIGASLYELLGLTGFGPSRLVMRMGIGEMRPYIPRLLLPTLLLTTYGGLACRRWMRRVGIRDTLALLLCAGVPMLWFCALALLMAFRFSGRHFAPLLPLLLLPMAWDDGPTAAPRVMRGLGLAVVLLWVAGSALVRFDPTHEREDYRAAARFALRETAAGRDVVVLAARQTLGFYGYWSDGTFDLDRLGKADTVVFSRPEVFVHPNLRPWLLARAHRAVPLATGFQVLCKADGDP